MTDNTLKIRKRRQQITLTLLGGEKVLGDVFLHYSRNEYGLPQEPFDLLNSDQPFIVLMYESGGVSFYNKAQVSYIRYIEEEDVDNLVPANLKENVAITLSGGEILSGEVTALLPPENMRLYDYLNQVDESYMRLKNEGGMVTLINKSCVIRVSETRPD